MTIAERAASTRPEDTAGLLQELQNTIRPEPASNWREHPVDAPWSDEEKQAFSAFLAHEKWLRGFKQQVAINTPESLLAAAMMLVEEGEEFNLNYSRMSVDMGGRNWRAQYSKHRANGCTPALALIAAIAASKGV